MQNVEYIVEALIQLADNRKQQLFGNIVIMAGGAGCYPKDTEFFTGNSWKKISDYTDGDNVLIFNKEKNISYLSKNVEYINLPLDNFYRIKNRRLDFVTSETHKHLLISDKTKKLYDSTTKDLFDKHNSLSRGNKSMLLTGFNYVGGSGIELTENELRLYIAIIADGYVINKNTNRIRISLKKDRKIKRLTELLKLCEINFKIYEENGFKRFVFNFNNSDKFFSDFWYNATKEQLEIISDEVLNWDGSITQKGKKSFSSTNYKSVEFIQFVFSALGNDVSKISTRKKDDCSDCYSININISKGVGISKNPRGSETTTFEKLDKDENERMFCFTTETGYFVVRQNDKIFVSGNSGKGLIVKSLLDVQGMQFDVDRLKELAIKSTKIKERVEKETGVDISKLSLKDPKNVTILHNILSSDIKLDDRYQTAAFSSIALQPEDRKPNLIFDVTLKDFNKLKNISYYAELLGYKKENIHIVWVVNDIDVAREQNLQRSRVVDDQLVELIHQQVAMTMKTIIDMGESIREYFDGKMYVVFNNKYEGDLNIIKNKIGGFYIKDGKYIKIKDKNKPIEKLDKDTINTIRSYTKGKFGF